MTKEELQDKCKKEIDNLSMISQEKKIDLGLTNIEDIKPIIDKYISLAYDYGSLNTKNRITLNNMNLNG